MRYNEASEDEYKNIYVYRVNFELTHNLKGIRYSLLSGLRDPKMVYVELKKICAIKMIEEEVCNTLIFFSLLYSRKDLLSTL